MVVTVISHDLIVIATLRDVDSITLDAAHQPVQQTVLPGGAAVPAATGLAVPRNRAAAQLDVRRSPALTESGM